MLSHYLIAVTIGASFGLLFQRDVRCPGSSICWGLGYGLFWWFLGPLTLMPILLGHAPTWSMQLEVGCVLQLLMLYLAPRENVILYRVR